jgi:hypothetical protein
MQRIIVELKGLVRYARDPVAYRDRLNAGLEPVAGQPPRSAAARPYRREVLFETTSFARRRWAPLPRLVRSLS